MTKIMINTRLTAIYVRAAKPGEDFVNGTVRVTTEMGEDLFMGRNTGEWIYTDSERSGAYVKVEALPWYMFKHPAAKAGIPVEERLAFSHRNTGTVDVAAETNGDLSLRQGPGDGALVIAVDEIPALIEALRDYVYRY